MKIFYNGKVFVPGNQLKISTALAVNDAKIIAIGSNESIFEQFGLNSQKYDLQNMTIWPGICDSHLHLFHLANMNSIINCETPTKKDCLEKIGLHAKKMRANQWVRGHGWNHNMWEEKIYGNASELDQFSHGHPVFLTAKSLHAAWVNKFALSLAGINQSTPDPEGGVILRDSLGNPTGILLENAVNLVKKFIPEITDKGIINNFKLLQSELFSYGITSAHDFDGINSFRILQILQKENLLKIRVLQNFPADLLPSFKTIGLFGNFGNDNLRTGFLKLFADGALGPQSAAMIDPYENSNNRGVLLLNSEEIFEIGLSAINNGWGLAVHAIGDLANRIVLDAFTELREYEQNNGLKVNKLRIEHAQLLNKNDQYRLKTLNVTASMQPIHCTSDMDMVDKHWGARSSEAYIFNKLNALGTKIIFGSDAPVETANPFYGLHAAVTRQKINGFPNPSGWHPEQRIRLDEALHAYTIAPAEVAGLKGKCGLLQPGYYADFIGLPENPFTVEPDQLFKIRPNLTCIGGEIVFEK